MPCFIQYNLFEINVPCYDFFRLSFPTIRPGSFITDGQRILLVDEITESDDGNQIDYSAVNYSKYILISF